MPFPLLREPEDVVAGVPAAPAAEAPLRVMVVDDSVVVRGLVSRWLTEGGGIAVTSTHRTGADAVRAVADVQPDVILLDIEMPDMDGMTALPLLLEKLPGVCVIIASTLTMRNADIALRCLQLGATDYISKPSTNRDVTVSTDFRRDLIAKVRTLGSRARARRLRGSEPPAERRQPHRPSEASARSAAPASRLATLPDVAVASGPAVTLRPLTSARPDVVVIGASTGGPQAINTLMRGLHRALDRVPIVIAQHMPTTFTGMFADQLRRSMGIEAAEATEGEPIRRGRLYIATGGRHLLLQRRDGVVRAVLDDGPPVNYCKPSVDVLFASASAAYGASVLGIVLTGMGSDGTRGGAIICSNGGNVIAQDEASSVVWGMPGSIARAGLCAAVLPIDDIGRAADRLVAGGGR